MRRMCIHYFVCALIVVIIAHMQALRKCGILHRDISIGNILIFPYIHFDEKTGKPSFIHWAGILSDWEMGKPIDVNVARQPERTVSVTCRHFLC